MQFFESLKKYFNNKSAFWAANYPKAWSLGWLTQLTIAVILYTLTFIVSILIPMETTSTPDVSMWYGLGYIPATFWAIFIIYRLIKYNSEKLYGNRSKVHNFIELPAYILQFIMPLLIPLILGMVLTYRVGVIIEDDKLSDFEIAFEEAQPFFSFDFGEGNYQSYDSYNFAHTMEYGSYSNMFMYFENDSTYYHSIIDVDENLVQESIFNQLNGEYYDDDDSLSVYIIGMRDSIAGHKGVFKDSRPKLYPYYFHEFSYASERYVNSDLLQTNFSQLDSIKRIYYYEHYKDEQFVNKKITRFLTAMSDFGETPEEAFSSLELMNLFEQNVYWKAKGSALDVKVAMFDKKISNYKHQLYYIQRCKNKDFGFYDDDGDGIYFFLFGFVFCFMLLFSLFKNMGWVEFLLGLFIVSLIPILSGIFIAIMDWEKDVAISIYWVMFIVLFVWGIIESKGNIRRKRGAILLMIPHLCLTFFLVAVLFTLDSVFNFWEWDYFDKYLFHDPQTYDLDNMSYNDTYWAIKGASGPVLLSLGYILFLFVIYPLWLKSEWLKFMAKPKKS